MRSFIKNKKKKRFWTFWTERICDINKPFCFISGFERKKKKNKSGEGVDVSQRH